MREVREAGRITASRCFLAGSRARSARRGLRRCREGQEKHQPAEAGAWCTWMQLIQCSGEGGNGNGREVGTSVIAHAHAYRHAGRARPVPLGSPGASVGPTSIPRHGTTHAGNGVECCVTGNERRDGQRQQSYMRRPPGRDGFWRCQRRRDTRRARRRRAGSVRDACGAGMLRCGQAAAHGVPVAKHAQSA